MIMVGNSKGKLTCYKLDDGNSVSYYLVVWVKDEENPTNCRLMPSARAISNKLAKKVRGAVVGKLTRCQIKPSGSC